MKTIISLILFSNAFTRIDAALILSTDLYITIADYQTFRRIIPAESLEANGENIPWYPYEYFGLGGGQMLIQVDSGETITAGSITYGVGPQANPTWRLQLKGQGISPDTFLWHFYDIGYETGSGGGSWQAPQFGNYETRIVPIYFEIQTSTGAIGRQFFIVPEPSTTILAGLTMGLAACLRRRGI